MQKATKNHSKHDEISSEESSDVKEFYTNKKEHKVSALKDLINELDS
ncbi:MAG: hypothetical protein WD154_06510 [Nitrosopumilaceae archaeon]